MIPMEVLASPVIIPSVAAAIVVLALLVGDARRSGESARADEEAKPMK